MLDQGAVLAQGTFAEVQSSEVDLSAITSLGDGSSPADLAALLGTDEGADAAATDPKAASRSEKATGDKTKDDAGATLVKDEERATGSVRYYAPPPHASSVASSLAHAHHRPSAQVSWGTHLAYVKAMGGTLSLLVMVVAVAWDKFLAVATDYWLTLWIDPSSSKLGEVTPKQSALEFWIPIYIAGVFLAGISVYFRSVFFNVRRPSQLQPTASRLPPAAPRPLSRLVLEHGPSFRARCAWACALRVCCTPSSARRSSPRQ